MDRTTLLNRIKELGNNYHTGSELVAMMDHYNVNSLSKLSDEQLRQYYEMIKDKGDLR